MLLICLACLSLTSIQKVFVQIPAGSRNFFLWLISWNIFMTWCHTSYDIPDELLFNNLSISTQLVISPQLTLPEDAQPRLWHTATALSLWPGQTQVIMFGGCPKWECGKSADVLQKLAQTTVLDFGEQNTQHFSVHFIVTNQFGQETPVWIAWILASSPGSFPYCASPWVWT